jgi:glycosyltransferase involved in cell wall biosynthesis
MSRKLMFVVNADWFFLSHRLPIALEAQRLGYQVHIATVMTGELAELEKYGLVVHPIALNRTSASLSNAIRTVFELWCLFRDVKPDLVHLVTIKPVLLGGIVARITKVPAVVAAVSGLGYVFVARGVEAVIRRWLVGALYRVAFGHKNLKVIFQNTNDRSMLSKLAKLPASKVEMISGSGVDLDQFSHTPLPLGEPVVLLAARLLADKGVREFVYAARMLKKQGIVARFCLCGSVDLSNPTSLTDAELAKWQREGVVELWGQRTDMPQVLRTAYLVVLPSYYGEGLPKVLIEAAACGRAVVTTDHPGCRDAIDPKVTGVLVPVRNAPALAEGIKELLKDPESCQSMGNAARNLAERAFDVRKVVATHLLIYQELIEKS